MSKPANAATYRKACVELALRESPRIVVEVGVYEGGLSRLLSAVPSVDRYCIVDSWNGDYCEFGQTHMDRVAETCMAWAESQPNVTVYRMDSAKAAALFEDGSIDFWHTDGDHSAEGITADITNWMPKVRVGGILSGDNYEADTVAQGVDKLLPHRQLGANGRFWWARK